MPPGRPLGGGPASAELCAQSARLRVQAGRALAEPLPGPVQVVLRVSLNPEMAGPSQRFQSGSTAGPICNAKVTCVRGNVVALERWLEDDTAPLWRAMADPTRRRILDLLRQRPLITGEIAAQFAISRIAVMRHLEVLSEAGLVTSRKRGRERWHYLNALPLQKLQRRWAEPVAAGFASTLLRLQDTVEAEGRHMESIRPTVDVALDIEIASSPGAVFAALTKDVGGWWGPPFVTARATSLTLEPRLGGLFSERWDNGGQVIASVTGWAEDEYLQLTGSFHMGVGIGVATFDLAESGTSTLLQFSFRALGVVDTAVAEDMSGGWAELVGTRLKTLVDAGTRPGIDPGETAS